MTWKSKDRNVTKHQIGGFYVIFTAKIYDNERECMHNTHKKIEDALMMMLSKEHGKILMAISFYVADR